MQISEFSFPHLHAAHDERLVIELERRRVAAERRAEAGTEGLARAGGEPRHPPGRRVGRSERPSSDAARRTSRARPARDPGAGAVAKRNVSD